MKFSFASRKLDSFCSPLPCKFKQWTCLNLIFEQFIVNFRDINIKMWMLAANSIYWSDNMDVQTSLTPSWFQRPSSTVRSKHKLYLHIIVWIVFLFCHMFQIKRLSLACSVLYLHRKSNTNVLMYVNLFFIKRIQASIIDSGKQ